MVRIYAVNQRGGPQGAITAGDAVDQVKELPIQEGCFQIGSLSDLDVSRVWKKRPKAEAGESGDGAIGNHTPKNHAEYTRHNSPPAAVGCITQECPVLGDCWAEPPAGCRAPPPAASGATPPSRATGTALALAGQTGPANFPNPRRERTTERSEGVHALETKFLRFDTRQER